MPSLKKKKGDLFFGTKDTTQIQKIIPYKILGASNYHLPPLNPFSTICTPSPNSMGGSFPPSIKWWWGRIHKDCDIQAGVRNALRDPISRRLMQGAGEALMELVACHMMCYFPGRIFLSPRSPWSSRPVPDHHVYSQARWSIGQHPSRFVFYPFKK